MLEFGALDLFWLLIPAALVGVMQTGSEASMPSAERLRTEYLIDPMGIDSRNPRLSWAFVQEGRGRAQSAYRIQIASSPEILDSGTPDVWDSMKTDSCQSTHISVTDVTLRSGRDYFWRVKVWDASGREGAWSQTATFSMGILDPEQWQAQWISAPVAGNGYHSELAKEADTPKWVQIDLGASRQFSAIELYPACPYNWNEDNEGFGYPVRFTLECSDDEDFKTSTVLVDFSQEDQPNPKAQLQTFSFDAVSARYVRLAVNRLYTRIDGQKLFAMAEFRVLSRDGSDVASGCPVKALDSREGNGWSASLLTAGLAGQAAPSRVAPLFRKEFTISKPVVRARAYVTGLGYYELRLNGRKVGDRVLDPARTNFDRRVLYSTYDVTDMVHEGVNCAGGILGKGWWGRPPVFLLQVEVEMEGGEKAVFTTGDGWKRGKSPILDNSLYHGETYDARLEQDGWDEPGFDDSGWEDAIVVESPTRELCAQMIQPIRVTDTLRPKRDFSPEGNIWVYDFGQNFSGWLQLNVAGPAGNTVTMKHAELLFPDNTVNMQNLRAAKATDIYTMRGGRQEIWEPRFTYHGFRYAQLQGMAGHGTVDTVRGKVVHTDFPKVGDFDCGNRLINQIHKNSVWGFRTNWHSIPTDCPQRDERQGWMGDAHMTADMGMYNYDAAAANIKFLQDIADSQREDGAVPDTVPHIWGTNPGDPMWSAAYHIICWDTYRHTGDLDLLRRHFDGLKRYVDMLEREADGYIITRNNYGDWVGVVETPKDLISTGSFILVARIVAKAAEALGQDEDLKKYQLLAAKVAEAFNERFLNLDDNVYGNGSQYSYVWPLYLGIVPESRRQAVAANLAQDIMENHNGHLSTGFMGARYLFEVLCNEGYADVAYTVVTQKDYPSYGYMIEMGATTIWELWKYETGGDMNSHNHPAFGFISGWFFRDIAGLRPLESAPGFQRFEVKPHLMGDLDHASAQTDTIRGKVACAWRREVGEVTLEVTVPANSSADVFVPKVKGGRVTIEESGTKVWEAGAFASGKGIVAGEDAGDWVKLQVLSGSYSFVSY